MKGHIENLWFGIILFIVFFPWIFAIIDCVCLVYLGHALFIKDYLDGGKVFFVIFWPILWIFIGAGLS